MDAARVAEVGRGALAASGGPAEVVGEAWQAQAVARAVGCRLVEGGPAAALRHARALAEAGERGCGPPDHPVLRAAGGIRAGRISGMADAERALTALGLLLEEVGMALVAVATVTDDSSAYWLCVEAIDAADETGECVTALLRHPGVRGRGGPSPPAGGSRWTADPRRAGTDRP